MSPNQAWRTVNRVNNANLYPGDGVLFQGGATFSDSTLMPTVNGTSSARVVFSSYGTGRATITRGVWFIRKNDLTFDNLILGPQGGLQGGNSGNPANNITVQRCTIDFGLGARTNATVGLNTIGDNWVITGNTIRNIGNSGLLLTGDRYRVSRNTIDNTGVDPAVGYPRHGIYLKATNATIDNNTITNFSSNGISVRYRNSVVTQNQISGGQTAIGWFQYDPYRGTSHWTNNRIATTIAGIYVSPSDIAGGTRENFVITGNHITRSGNTRGWTAMNLKPTTGTFTVSNNILG